MAGESCAGAPATQLPALPRCPHCGCAALFLVRVVPPRRFKPPVSDSSWKLSTPLPPTRHAKTDFQERWPHLFCLPPAQPRRSLPRMAATSQNKVPTTTNPARPGLALCLATFGSSLPAGCDTLHCTKFVQGSAVQFNSSVSAMPDHVPQNSHTLVPGTADTLLLCWAP